MLNDLVIVVDDGDNKGDDVDVDDDDDDKGDCKEEEDFGDMVDVVDGGIFDVKVRRVKVVGETSVEAFRSLE